MIRPLVASVVALALLSPLNSFAISNIENMRPGPPDEGFSGALELGLNGKTGDKREEDYIFNSRLNYRKSNDLFFVIASREYGKTRAVKDTDDAFIHFRWAHNFTPRLASEAFTQWEEDEFSNLVSRTLLGGGARYLVASETDVYSFSIGLGAFREFESLDLSTYTLDTQTWRVNSYYSYSHNLNDKTTIASTAYLQPSTDDIEDVRVLLTFSLSVKMTEARNLKVAYEAKFDSYPAKNLQATPPIDKNKTNTEYNTSLVYRF